MSNRSSAAGKRSPAAKERSLDSEEVLDLLRDLIQQVSSPVVQECLRSARHEIAFLTSTDGEFMEEDEDEEEQEDVAEMPMLKEKAG